MSLIKCPDCEKEISSYASVCPDCGCPREMWEQSEEAINEKKTKKSPDSDNANFIGLFGRLRQIHDEVDKEFAEERIENTKELRDEADESIEELKKEIEELENKIKDSEDKIEDKRRKITMWEYKKRHDRKKEKKNR